MPKMASSGRSLEGDPVGFPIVRVCSLFHRFRAPVLAVYAVAAVVVCANAIHRATNPKRSSEYRAFCEIARESVVEGNDHYETIPHRRAYPPFFCLTFAPFALQPPVSGAVTFVLLCMAFGVLSVWLTTQAAFGGKAPPGAALVVFLLAGTFILSVVARCETDLLVLFPLAIALWGLSLRPSWRKDAVAGALLGFAAILKLTPGLFGVFLLIHRRWVALVSMAASVVLLGFGLAAAVWGVSGTIQRYQSWHERILKPYSEVGPTHFIARAYREINQSPTAALCRLLNKEHAGTLWERGPRINLADLPLGTVRRIAFYVKLAVLALLVWGWWRSAGSASPLALSAAFSSVVLGMLLLGDVSLQTHHVTLVFPYAVCLAALAGEMEEGARKRFTTAFVAAIILLVFSATHVGKTLSVLALSDFILLACMLALLASGGRSRRSVQTPPQSGGR